MRYEKQVWLHEDDNRWCYRILDFGSVCINQEWHPHADGYTPMSEQEANEFADAILANWNAPQENN